MIADGAGLLGVLALLVALMRVCVLCLELLRGVLLVISLLAVHTRVGIVLRLGRLLVGLGPQ